MMWFCNREMNFRSMFLKAVFLLGLAIRIWYCGHYSKSMLSIISTETKQNVPFLDAYLNSCLKQVNMCCQNFNIVKDTKNWKIGVLCCVAPCFKSKKSVAFGMQSVHQLFRRLYSKTINVFGYTLATYLYCIPLILNKRTLFPRMCIYVLLVNKWKS